MACCLCFSLSFSSWSVLFSTLMIFIGLRFIDEPVFHLPFSRPRRVVASYLPQ